MYVNSSKVLAWTSSALAFFAWANLTLADSFTSEIYPLLKAHCFKCHGPDKRKGGLRLDRKREAMLGGDSGSVIFPGDSQKSPLFRLIAGLEGDKRMPPEGEGLMPKAIATVREWIDTGAEWPQELEQGGADVKPEHWAFQKPVQPVLPSLPKRSWPRNAIDHFILARLEEENVEPSPIASKTTLIRRLSFDLCGLPPTPGEVSRFLADHSPDAYENLVDRMLASPAFGEQWGRYWLDKARYADSDGYEKDNIRPYAWLWRDWALNAINRDQPYDQFSVEQLAGDLLPNATRSQQLATGFHRNTLTNTEGGTDQEEFRVKAVVDRLTTTGGIWLGLTVGCAECHTHKYDPITQREFYEMFAFFNTSDEKSLSAPQPEELRRYESLKKTWDEAKAGLEAEQSNYLESISPKKQAEWEAVFKVPSVHWTSFQPSRMLPREKTKLTSDKASQFKATGENPDTITYTIEGKPEVKKLTGLRLQTLPINDKGAGRASNGNFVVSELKALLVQANGKSRPLKLTQAQATFSQDKFNVSAAIDGKSDAGFGWAVAPRQKESHTALFNIEPTDLQEGHRVRIDIEQNHGTRHTLGAFEIVFTDSTSPLKLNRTPESVIATLALSPKERTEDQQRQVQEYFRDNLDTGLARIRKRLDEHKKRAPKFPSTKAAVLAEQAKPRKSHIHVRGDFLRKGTEVQPTTPSLLHSLKSATEKPSRLDFAHWLFDKENPLTGRVTANHIWHHLFGQPLVKTIEDFGTRGEKPSHPGLLDWLAAELPQFGWSRKAMIRLIVTSATYRQSSTVRPGLLERDPENRLLARQNRFRIDAEAVRDTQLSAAGLLSLRQGGPSVKPPLPADIAALGYANSVKWKESGGENKYRRGFYIHAQRTVPYPMLKTFDSNDPATSCIRRERSNTPIQALTLLNDPVFFEVAQVLGQRMENADKDLRGKIRFGFKRCFSREPQVGELEHLETLYKTQRKLITNTPESVVSITGMKEATPELAALTTVARVMLNLDEAITRD